MSDVCTRQILPIQKQSLTNTSLEICNHFVLNTSIATEKQIAPFPLLSSRGARALSVLWKLNCCSPNTLHLSCHMSCFWNIPLLPYDWHAATTCQKKKREYVECVRIKEMKLHR